MDSLEEIKRIKTEYKRLRELGVSELGIGRALVKSFNGGFIQNEDGYIGIIYCGEYIFDLSSGDIFQRIKNEDDL